MPLPTPNDGESKKDFLDRCMANPTMNDDFPDNAQRFAVCNSQWDKASVRGPGAQLTAKTEKRWIDVAELRTDRIDGDDPVIKGYAAVFDALSQPIMGFQEIVRKGAFRKTLKESDVRALHNHDANYVWGRKANRTLRMHEDEKGLAVTIMPPDAQWARDVMVSIDRGDVSQMSFGFQTIKDRWTQEEKLMPLRELLEVRLFDVSTVTFPAYPQTEVHVRAIMDAMLCKLDSGEELKQEERSAMAAALDAIKKQLVPEPRAPHSGKQEPGNPHSIPPHKSQPGNEPRPPHSHPGEPAARHSEEDERRALQSLRLRLNELERR